MMAHTLSKKLPRTITVEVDSQEKKGLLFPPRLWYYPARQPRPRTMLSIRVNRLHLPAGDYQLKGYTKTCIAERKGSIHELGANLLSEDWTRQQKAFDKLANATRHPILLLDGTPAAFTAPSDYGYDQARVWSAFWQVVSEYGFHVIWMGASGLRSVRQRVGAQLLYFMIAKCFHQPSIKNANDFLTRSKS